MTPFEKFLEARGFHADACRSTTHPDLFAITERLWGAVENMPCGMANVRHEDCFSLGGAPKHRCSRCKALQP